MKESVWLLGGCDDQGTFGDAWRTDSSGSWAALPDPPWPPRSDLAAVVRADGLVTESARTLTVTIQDYLS